MSSSTTLGQGWHLRKCRRTMHPINARKERPMVAEFNNAGIHFNYPENWQLELEDTEDGWAVSVQSPDSAFLFLCLREDMPTQEEVLEATLEALRVDYPD